MDAPLIVRGDPSARFWGHVTKGAGCWEWAGNRSAKGYGRVYWNGGPEFAHRVSWALANGGALPSLRVLHRCDNRPCVKPAHLFLGTDADNSIDMAKKERGGGNKLTAADVLKVRKMLATGANQSETARAFGVTQGAVWCILRRRTWKHV